MKTRTRVLGLFVAAGLAATPAVAIPPALDHVAADTPVVIGVRDLSHLVSSAKHWGGMFAPEEAMAGFQMAEMMLGMPGVNASGSAAVAVTFVEDQPGPPVLVVPVSDYGDFVEGAQGEASDGVATIELMGEAAYAKNLGDGFAALSPDFDAVTNFDGADGQIRSHETRLGKTAKPAADKADFFVIVDVEAMRPHLEQGLEMMAQNMSAAAMMGEAVEAQVETMMSVARSVVNDGRTAFIGLGSGDDGLWLDFAAQFADDSDTGKVFAEDGNAGALMKRLPAMDYIAAFAFDASSPGIRHVMAQAAAMNEGMGGFGASMNQLAELQDGQAMVIGVTPGLFTGGLFANTIQFNASKDPEALLEGYKSLMEEMNGQTQQGIKLTTSFEENAKTEGDTPLHAYGVTMAVDPEDENAVMAGAALQQMSFVFGPEAGPKGYIALTEGGMYQTMARNSSLIGKALESGESLTTNAGIRDVSGHLPDNRTAVAYINVKGVTDMVAPMLAMMGGIELGEIPADLHPIATSLSTGGGGMHGRLFMPADVLNMISELSKKFNSGDEWEEVEEEPASKPRF